MLLEKRRAEAIATLHEFITTKRGGSRLDGTHVADVAKGAVAAWEVRIAEEACVLGVGDNFPFTPPQIWLSRDSAFCKAPHVEGNGRLCLNPTQSNYAQGDVVSLTEFLLKQAEELLSKCRAGANEDDFVTEFKSYWTRDQKQDPRSFLTLVRPDGPSRAIRCFENEKVVLFAERNEDAQSWLKNRYGSAQEDTAMKRSVLVWFNEALHPKDYPKTAKQFYRLAKSRAADSLPHLRELVEGKGRGVILFGFNTENGPAFGALVIKRPQNFEKGFRAGRVVGDVAVARCYGSEAILSGDTTRVDHSWIHTRGGELEQAQLGQKSVMLIGCGSLGSGIAALLAKSGVGKLVLCDGETLAWANIARHHLGAQSVKKSKAEALANELKADLPHLRIECLKGQWQSEHATAPELFMEADLIICTTGEWASESALNFVARRTVSFPPVLFGWAEAHAVAGHGLLVGDVGGCLGCGSDQHGGFAAKVTEWPETGTMVSEAACGGQYQPFGWIHLTHVQGLVAEMVVESLLGRISKSQLRSWIASRDTVRRFAGDWSANAIKLSEGREDAFCTVRDWPCSPNCKLCGE